MESEHKTNCLKAMALAACERAEQMPSGNKMDIYDGVSAALAHSEPELAFYASQVAENLRLSNTCQMQLAIKLKENRNEA